MMNEPILDKYLRAYRSETGHMADAGFKEKILTIANQKKEGKKHSRNFWRGFDLPVPRAVGWVLTCILGLYLGLPRVEQPRTQEDYFLYDQAQILLSEDLTLEDSQK